MWSTIGTAFLGFVGGIAGGFLTWIVTNFLGTPVVDFRTLSEQVQEELIHTGNVGPLTAHRSEYDKAQEPLRRLGARMQSAKDTAEWPLRWYVRFRGYDLQKASSNLIGLSNALAQTDNSRVVHRDRIQVALKLPPLR
jgi:hypothetical protein